MQRLFVLGVLLVITCSADLQLDVVGGTNAGFGLGRVATGFTNTITSALPFLNAAGVSKLMIPATDSIIVINDDGTEIDVAAALAASPPTATSKAFAGVAQDIANLGTDIYLTGGTNLYRLNSDGTTDASLHSFGESVHGLVGNPTDHKLYLTGNSGVLSFDVISGDSGEPILTPGVTGNSGIALSPNYQTYYVAQQVGSNDDMVQGFNLIPDRFIPVYRSSNVDSISGVIAGTGCLADYIFVAAANQIIQISFRGVQTVIAADVNINNRGGFFKYDPRDGSVLIPWGTDLYRISPPTCGGFAGPTRFRADAYPFGSPCLEDTDCSSQRCLTTCQRNQYLGTCQSNDDCESGVTTDGYFCALPLSAQDKPRKSGKKHHDDDDRRPPPFGGIGVNPALYGVCEINLCVTNMGGCDPNAICTPTGDRQRICSCAPGFFGTGLYGQCINACDTVNNGCFPTAECTALSATTVQCRCPVGLWGTGVGPNGCVNDPCHLNTDCGQGSCTPTGENANDFFCSCDDGFFLTDDTPRCVMDLCALNGGDGPCVANSYCTPGHNMGVASTSCSCDPGFAASALDVNGDPISCIAAACSPLEVGVWPLADAHSTQGNCQGATTGQTCFFGCMNGYKPTGSTRAVCIPSQTPGSAVFSLTPFACELDLTRDRDHDDVPSRPWYCGIPAVSPCAPSAPYLESKDSRNGNVKLRWLPLTTASPLGDVVESLAIRVSPQNGIAYLTSSIPTPTITKTWTITGLNPGGVYTFRLVVVTSHGTTTGAPLTVSL